jgi:BTB/POZ domain-containing protein KCTD9
MSKPCQSEPASPSPAAGTLITLQVGEQCFVTTSETLKESGFFSALLSGRWDNAQADGSYFIDADAGIFKHVLLYLRRGILPVFYDNAKGHDHALYLALLEEAKYFQIPRLEKWIEDKTYLEAVKIKYSMTELDSANPVAETISTDTETELHPFYITKKLGSCRNYIPSHRCLFGSPEQQNISRFECARECWGGQYTEDTSFGDKQFLKLLLIRKTVVFDLDICREGR